jgi:hypothetical protein
MGWTIIEQEETVGREKIPVLCKNVRFFPMEKQGEIHFGKLGFLLLQVIVENEKGYQLRLKLNASEGIRFPRFVIAHPDKMDYPTIKVGAGRNRKEMPDTLSPKVRKPGEKETLNTTDFENRVSKMFGQEAKDRIMGLFAFKLAEVAGC